MEQNKQEKEIPMEFLDKLYEMTGNESGELGGYVLFYSTSLGNVKIARKTTSQIVQLVLDNAVDNYKELTSEEFALDEDFDDE